MFPSFEILGTRIFTYPLLIGMAWAISYFKYIDYKLPKSLFFGLFLSSWFGAKFLFLLTLSSDLAQNLNTNNDFWLGGGFVFYGGLLLSVAFLYLYARGDIYKFQNLVPALCLGHGIGRVGCFLAGCCYGVHHIPVQLIESMFLISLYFFIKKKENKIVFYLITYCIFRFLIEFLRNDPIRGFGPLGLSTSQLISLGILILISTKRLRLLLRLHRPL